MRDEILFKTMFAKVCDRTKHVSTSLGCHCQVQECQGQ